MNMSEICIYLDFKDFNIVAIVLSFCSYFVIHELIVCGYYGGKN